MNRVLRSEAAALSRPSTRERRARANAVNRERLSARRNRTDRDARRSVSLLPRRMPPPTEGAIILENPQRRRIKIREPNKAESVTELLIRWSRGERDCLDRLVPLVESELRRIAHHYMQRERADHTLQTTALVNEVYLKLVDQAQVDWQNRAQFLTVAARLTRQILVDYARSRNRLKRGGRDEPLTLDGGFVFSDGKPIALVALDDALRDLAGFDARKAQIVEMRFFGGMTAEETAQVLGVHTNTVLRDWSLAKSWLRRELRPSRGAHAG